jgi:hypothetical protein
MLNAVAETNAARQATAQAASVLGAALASLPGICRDD